MFCEKAEKNIPSDNFQILAPLYTDAQRYGKILCPFRKHQIQTYETKISLKIC